MLCPLNRGGHVGSFVDLSLARVIVVKHFRRNGYLDRTVFPSLGNPLAILKSTKVLLELTTKDNGERCLIIEFLVTKAAL